MRYTHSASLFAATLITVSASNAHAQCTPGWSGINSGTNSTVYSLTVLPDGDVVAGGSYTLAGGVSTPNKAARYSYATNTWSSLGTGTNGSIVHSLAVLPDGDVLAGGNFTSIGGVATRQFARFDFGTQTWSGLGYGNNGGSVMAILVLAGGNEVIIGGNIPRVNGFATDHCARLNLTTGVWTTMHSNFVSSGDTVLCLAQAPDGTVILGGTFLNSPGGSSRIARYNPTTSVWSPLGTGMNSTVEGVAVLSNGDVIAGGNFTTAGGVTVNRIARWDNAASTWNAMGTGVTTGIISCLTRLPDDSIVVGGSFTAISGIGASRVARCIPATNTWSALGSGTNQQVESLAALPTGQVVVGGFFTAGISQYSFGGTSVAITDQPDDAVVCQDLTATFSVAHTGTSPVSYQWRKNTAAIDTIANPSAATATLILPGVQVPDTASYDCVLSNACGQVTSTPATLLVNASDFDGDGDTGTDADITAFFACLGGNCCPTCGSPDFDGDGDTGTDADLEAFFRVLGGGPC